MVIENCLFRNNYVGLKTYNSTVQINSSKFESNNNYFLDCGAIIHRGYRLTVTNSVFVNNLSDYNGAAICNNSYSWLDIINSSFAGNVAEKGAAIYGTHNRTTIINSIFWGNSSTIGHDAFKNYFVIGSDSEPDITYSLVQSGFTGRWKY